MNDNRKYQYSKNSFTDRREYKVILDIIPERSKIIDLGCGDGSLIKLLKKKKIKAEGLDSSQSAVSSTVKKGLKARKLKIDGKLPYKDNNFDWAICNVTLHMVNYPEILISEAFRISKNQIFTFPNFAFFINRFELMFKGRMPTFMLSGYEWYSTGHTHQLSLKDFEKYCLSKNIFILNKCHLYPKQLVFIPKDIKEKYADFFATMGIYVTGNKKSK